MVRLNIDLSDDAWQALAADFAVLRSRGWGGVDRDVAGRRFGSAALLVGGRVLSAHAPDVVRAAELLRAAGQVPAGATEADVLAQVVGAALAVGLARLLGPAR